MQQEFSSRSELFGEPAQTLKKFLCGSLQFVGIEKKKKKLVRVRPV